jgi:hypothetical protein
MRSEGNFSNNYKGAAIIASRVVPGPIVYSVVTVSVKQTQRFHIYNMTSFVRYKPDVSFHCLFKDKRHNFMKCVNTASEQTPR